MSALAQIAKVTSIATSFAAAGGIAALSLFDVPELQAQPADRSLPGLRWLFSRGSHIFPQTAIVSAAAFAYLAYDALPPHVRSLAALGWRSNAYLAAAILTFGIGPYTHFVMIPNNFALIEMNEKEGGARSANAAKELARSGVKPGQRSAEDSVNGKGEGGNSEFADLSIPQEKTPIASTKAEDDEARRRLERFGRENMGRAVLMAAGGLVGLVTTIL